MTKGTMRRSDDRPASSFAALTNHGSTFAVPRSYHIGASTCTEAAGQGTTHYKLVKVLGHGNMGTVFLAGTTEEIDDEGGAHATSAKAQKATGDTDINYDYRKWVALKVMSKTALSTDQDCFQRAEAELDCLSAASGTAAVPSDDADTFLPRLRDLFETPEHRVLVTDFCEGGDLNSVRRRQPDKTFSVAAARFYAAEVVQALERLHELGFVYRDLKPENVLVRSTGHVTLTDFDLSLRIMQQPAKESTGRLARGVKQSLRQLAAAAAPAAINGSKEKGSMIVRGGVTGVPSKDIPSSRSLVGTDEYIAPEILWGTAHGFAVDWWTLGVMLYEMVYGTTPFKSSSKHGTFHNILCKQPRFHALHPAADDAGDLKDLMARLLVKDPAQRLGSEGGANAVKSHAFFRGVCWQALPSLAATPFIPSSCHRQAGAGSVLNLEEHMAEGERLRSKCRQRSAAHYSTFTGGEKQQPCNRAAGAGGRDPAGHPRRTPHRDLDFSVS